MSKTLQAGTIVQAYGLPVRLTADVAVETHEGNWELIQADHAKATDGSGPGNARPDGSYGTPVDDRLHGGPNGSLSSLTS